MLGWYYYWLLDDIIDSIYSIDIIGWYYCLDDIIELLLNDNMGEEFE